MPQIANPTYDSSKIEMVDVANARGFDSSVATANVIECGRRQLCTSITNQTIPGIDAQVLLQIILMKSTNSGRKFVGAPHCGPARLV